MVTNPEVRTIQQYAGGEVDLVGVDVPASLDRRSVGDFEVPGKVRAHIIVRNHAAMLAEPAVEMQAGDRIYFAVSRGNLPMIEQFFNGE
jgi:Trk K+ transport system NAD-binding subunit